jgi:hypothetical protein
MNDRYFSGFHLAGFMYHEGVAVFQELKVGAALTMVAERDNNFDPYAVALYYSNRKLVYIARSENRHISQFLNLAHINLFEAHINRLTPDAEPSGQVGVVVRINKKRKNKFHNFI